MAADRKPLRRVCVLVCFDNTILGKVCCVSSSWLRQMVSPSDISFRQRQHFPSSSFVPPPSFVKWSYAGEISSDSRFCTQPHTHTLVLCVWQAEIDIKLQWAAVIFSCCTSCQGLSIYKIYSCHVSLMVTHLCDCLCTIILGVTLCRCWAEASFSFLTLPKIA